MSEAHFQSDAGLVRATGRLAVARSLAEVISILRDTARDIVGSDGIAVVLREGESCFYAAEDAIEPLWRGRRFPLAACISGWVMLNDETAVVPDIAFDHRVPIEAYRTTSMRSLVMVPIGSPEPTAALGAYWCTSVIPDDGTVCRLETLAHQAAVALIRIDTPAREGGPEAMSPPERATGQPG
ncbi:GAF domain-containing protein [Methylobacterium sp. J-048]|uniref:GAF domain-containing protein n=1 Tax=Methylobacterium sp. J-048 TaxID=2836635 RepID=UPI001FBB6630|nr:GAF domain-containing protein [Methylobacterium sp. J-048]MCJ2058207.1 GAF domain-containing protein [Methylobacterium sp. J-048]